MKTRLLPFTGMTLTAALLLGAAPLALVGCHDNRVDHRDEIGFSISASQTDILVGEVVTLTANTRDTMGKDVSIEWRSTGGDLDTEQNETVARVQFDKAGTYSVTADLLLNDVKYKSDTRVITVRPVR